MIENYAFATAIFISFSFTIFAQNFPISIEPEYGANEVRLVKTPIKSQILFIGGETTVQTTPTYNNPASQAPAKQWNDFIGFTPDLDNEGAGWVSVNHERIEANDLIGDGGGMTVFKIKRSADTLIVVDQTLDDGRSGKYFNVDFVNTVGGTGMNCGGICSIVDGRIWSAEEWLRFSNKAIWDGGVGIRDTANFILNTPEFSNYNGKEIKAFEKYNWMVEVDPRQAKAIRKQYNWGRQQFEGGTILPDNKTVLLGADNTPGYLSKFVADLPGIFTKGKLYVYKHNIAKKWVEIDNTLLANMLNHPNLATQLGATMFNRIEWLTYDKVTNAVYFSATGRDKPGNRFSAFNLLGAAVAPHHIKRAVAQGLGEDGWKNEAYSDYYGRIMKYDVLTNEVSVFLEGGPDVTVQLATIDAYPEIHLSNPDALSIYINKNGNSFLIIQEDLNGDTFGRTPIGSFGDFARLNTCEMFALDLSIKGPTYSDLIRLAIMPFGAEVTGAIQTKDGKSLLVNSQHPSTDNPYPYNHSLTIAINGIDEILNAKTPVSIEAYNSNVENGLKIYPNPATRLVSFSKSLDVALYNAKGVRLAVYRNSKTMDVSKFEAGTYFVTTLNGKTTKLIIE